MARTTTTVPRTETAAARTTTTAVDRPVHARINIASATHALLRIGAAILFFQHGAQKLLGWFGGIDQAGGTVPLFSLFGAAGVLELVGGVLLVVGLFVRPVAAILVVEMIVAYFHSHMPQGGWPVQNQGELALLYALVFAFLAAHGAGPLSLDRVIRIRWWRDGRGKDL